MEKFLQAAGYLATGVLSFYLSEKRKEWKNRRLLKNSESLCVEKDAKINARLAQLLFAIGGDKAKIFRFHNGAHYYTGQSIKKISLTHLHLRTGVAGPVVSELKDIPTSLFPNMLTQLLQTKGATVNWHVDQAPDAHLKTLHMSEGTVFVKCTALRNANGEMLGILSINWISDQPEQSEKRKELMLQFAEEIGHLLSQET